MRLVRTAAAAAVGLSLVVAGTSGAATKPVCNLITDATGDASATTAASVPGTSDGALDVLSADLAADKKVLTAVIRVSKLAESAATAPNGYSAVFTFSAPSAPDVPLYMRYFSGSDLLDSSFEFGYDDATNGLTPLGDAAGVLDTAKNEIRISAPLSGFSEKAVLKQNDKLGTFDVAMSRDLVALLVYADRATSGATYSVGAKSCVTPGK